MPRRIHPPQTRQEKKAKVLKALASLHAEGFTAAGPADIAREVDESWVRVNGIPAAGALHPVLRELCDEGKVERLPQGVRRAHYRLVETI